MQRRPRPTGRPPLPVWAAVAILLVGLTGCAPGTAIRSARPLGEIRPPVFEWVPGQTSIERFDPPGAGAGLAMTVGTLVRNPNSFSIRLTSIRYKVFLQGEPVSQGTLRPAIYLEPGATAPIRFPVHSALKDKRKLLHAVVRAFADTPLPFRIDGTLRFDSASYGFETRTSALVEGATLARQTVAPPRLRLDETATRAFTLRPGVPVVQVVVAATNPGDIGYFLYGKDLALTLAGQELAREDMHPVPLAAGQRGRIDLVFYPDPAKLDEAAGAALQAALKGIPTFLSVQGTLTMDVLGVDSFAVPPGWEISGFVSSRSSTH